MRRVCIAVVTLILSAAPGCGNGDSKKTAPDLTDAVPEETGGQNPVDIVPDPGPENLCCEDLPPEAKPLDIVPETEVTPPVDLVELTDLTPDEIEPPPDIVDVENVEPEIVPDIAPDLEPELPEEVTEEVVDPQPCILDFDCEPGESCILGWCEPFVPECDDEMECPDGETCLEGVCLEEGMSPAAGKILFNEVLADGNTDGDPNQDGTKDPMEDEFVELVNVSNETLDLSGWMLVENDWEEWLPRYTFVDGFALAPKEAVVIFGGGDAPESTDAVFYATSNADDPGIPYGLDLDDSGDLVRLVDPELLTVAAFAYGDAGGTPATSDESLTRDPDLTGTFAPHTFADGADGAVFSPGTRVDGSEF
jgi:hypothetical protein